MAVRRSVVTTVLAAVIAVTVVAAGVTYATAGAPGGRTVKACADAKGRLSLQSKKGKCAKRTSTVTLNQQGPQGARGATGATGPAGPGARAIYLSSSVTTTGPTIKVGEFSYYASCDIDEATQQAETRVYVNGPADSSLNTLYATTVGASTTPTTSSFRSSFTGLTWFRNAVTNNLQRLYVDAMRVVGADGTVQLVSVDMSVDSRATPSGERCVVSGLVIPST